jgi:HEAT repeat protein
MIALIRLHSMREVRSQRGLQEHMQDNHLLEDLQRRMDSYSADQYENLRISFQEMIDQLKQHNITTYTQLCTLIDDEQAAPSLRDRAMYAAGILRIDKRRTIPRLLRALQSPDDAVRIAAARQLGMSLSRRTIAPLIEIILNKREAESLRNAAIYALGSIGDKRAAEPFRQLMFDTSESPLLRGEAIERSTYLAYEDRQRLVEDYASLLSDAIPDVRFWALYALTTVDIETLDREKLLGKVDAIAAFDQVIPETFGWHVSREALLLLE